jgi:hypothetical protein
MIMIIFFLFTGKYKRVDDEVVVFVLSKGRNVIDGFNKPRKICGTGQLYKSYPFPFDPSLLPILRGLSKSNKCTVPQ